MEEYVSVLWIYLINSNNMIILNYVVICCDVCIYICIIYTVKHSQDLIDKAPDQLIALEKKLKILVKNDHKLRTENKTTENHQAVQKLCSGQMWTVLSFQVRTSLQPQELHRSPRSLALRILRLSETPVRRHVTLVTRVTTLEYSMTIMARNCAQAWNRLK